MATRSCLIRISTETPRTSPSMAHDIPRWSYRTSLTSFWNVDTVCQLAASRLATVARSRRGSPGGQYARRNGCRLCKSRSMRELSHEDASSMRRLNADTNLARSLLSHASTRSAQTTANAVDRIHAMFQGMFQGMDDGISSTSCSSLSGEIVARLPNSRLGTAPANTTLPAIDAASPMSFAYNASLSPELLSEMPRVACANSSCPRASSPARSASSPWCLHSRNARPTSSTARSDPNSAT
mmetsp:Transcript_6488/g.17930  ORF Transcript_6488/g.17930 Transcript_6488/m.17930 type:complete len:240 (+) Transcript_6488:2882-3601(+)